jgi:mono/diheme cytochrome c family protein
VQAIREGVGKNGRPLLGMTSWSFRYLSDEDVLALVAYLRSSPPVANAVPRRDLNLIAALSVGIGLAPTSVQPPIAAPVVAPKPGANAAYGRYLTAMSGCRDCHGANLNGGRAPLGIELLSATPLGPSLFVSTVRLREDGFVSTMKTGVRPNGKAINGKLMPWQDFAGAFSDDDLKAIFAYLSSVSAEDAAVP